MAQPSVQIFLRSSDLGLQNPPIIALHPDVRKVDNTTYGDGMTIYWLTMDAVKYPAPDSGDSLRLVDNWQNYITAPAVTMEATQRIESAFSTMELIDSLHQSIVMMETYGTDISKWPAQARQIKAEIDAKWKYIDEVKIQAEAHIAHVPHDLSSDKMWPARPKK